MTRPYPVPISSDEPLGSVTRVLALEETDGEDAFTGASLPQHSGRVYGGQVVAQGLLAASATLIDDGDGPRLPHSVHAYFMRGGKPEAPIRFDVERMHDGRSFSQRRTTASQDGAAILTMVSSFQETQEGAEVQLPAPQVPRPEELTSALEIFRTIDHPVARFLGRTAAFDLRHVEGNIYLHPGEVVEGRQHLWARSRGQVPPEASQVVHRALLAYMCDQLMLEPALRSQGLSWRSEGMSLATLDHAQWFHRDVDVGDWLLFVQDSPTSQGGRSMARAEVFDAEGRLVSTIAQEGMVRMPTADRSGTGRWAIRVAEGDDGSPIPDPQADMAGDGHGGDAVKRDGALVGSQGHQPQQGVGVREHEPGV
ncbi:acyl-CoA thioesterase [Actinomyces respiraculi]|uniref:acyl-CoA thioesterase n=1 Tax=Actinomyces respiraculi TaxID=2744574 RepID=UPI00142360B0|nr:acyl-CoA thioesterase domain-containing protein [Actinomyces respiraculi]